MNNLWETTQGLMIPALLLGATLRATAVEPARPDTEGLDVQVYLTVTPTPQKEWYGNAFYRVRSAALVADDAAGEDSLLAAFQTLLKKRMALDLAVKPADLPKNCDLLIRLAVRNNGAAGPEHPAHPHPENAEGYVLTIGEQEGRVEAAITGNSRKGVQHGLQSLRQLMMPWKGSVVVRQAKLVDWPDIRFRFVKRQSDYWFDQAVLYKMNGGTQPLSLSLEPLANQAQAGLKARAAAAQERQLSLLGMVSMGNIYRGSEDAVRKSTAYFTTLHELGFTHLALMNDDKMTLADAEARRRFGGYYQTQLHYLTAIDAALRNAGYRESLGFMPNEYQNRTVNEDLAAVLRGKWPGDCALFWDGDHRPGATVEVEDFKAMLDQIKAKRFWYYTNWPQVKAGFWSDNYGATRLHHFGDGHVVELVTVSTQTTPELFPISFITMADRLWNAAGYDPDRALQRAAKELLDPESFPAFFALFKYLESLAPVPTRETLGPMYVADEPEKRRETVRAQGARLDERVAACRSTPLAQEKPVRELLDTLAGRTEAFLQRLAADEAVYAKGLPLRKLIVPTSETEPKLDGRLDEPVWRTAAVADRFTDFSGSQEAPHQTTVKIVRTKDKLYFGITCLEPHMASEEFIDAGFSYPLAIDSHLSGFLWWFEEIELFLDPGRDRKNCFQLILNPWGLKECYRFDGTRYGFHGIAGLTAFPLPVEGMVNKLDDAWVLEFAIPFSAFAPARPQGTWGFNVGRTRRMRIGNGLKYSTWTPLSWGYQDSRNFGEMSFP